MSSQLDLFRVDEQLLRIIPRASASLKNPDVNFPMLRADNTGYYLEMRVDADHEEASEISLTRRIPLDNLSSEEWEDLKEQYGSLDLESYLSGGIKALEQIDDKRVQRLTAALLTFLNPRQVSIVLYLYKAASEQNANSTVSFRSNDLLEVMGYKRTSDGGFSSVIRSKLHCDLMALHRTELLFAEEIPKDQDDDVGAKVTIKNILRIKEFEVDKVPRSNFDVDNAADYTYESADAYTVSLEFFETPEKGSNYVLFGNIDMTQRQGSSAKHDYKTKLLMYLANRLQWDKPKNGQILTISKRYLFKHLELFGRNSSRNSQTFWRTVGELKEDGYVLSAKELPGKNKSSKNVLIEFQINPEQLRLQVA